jgi:membrane-associated protein
MNTPRQSGPTRWRRVVVYALLLWLFFGGLAPCLQPACAQAPPAPEGPAVTATAEEKPNFFMQVIQNLFNSRELMRTLGQPEYTLLAFIALNLIVFTETGLLIGFFLPGDSLLVVAGVVCYAAGWDLPLLLVTLCVSAILGDSVGYSIGFKAGPKIFNREKSWFFNKDHLLKAQHFYERHGGKTIVLARFMPLIRTFAPVVAGAGRMEYRRFLFFNIFGGIGWVVSMILIGYYLTRFINPTLQPIFGTQFDVLDHIEKVVIVVVLLSISPGIYVWLRSKFKRQPQPAEPEPVAARAE